MPPPAREEAKQKTRRAPTKPKRVNELEQLELRIGQQEKRVKELEAKLAEDWSEMDLLSAHTAAREELQGLLERWEVLFAEVQASP